MIKNIPCFEIFDFGLCIIFSTPGPRTVSGSDRPGRHLATET